jgi:hypothetical protein
MNYPDVIQPWNTPIGKWNYAEKTVELQLLDELMQHPAVMQDTKVGSLRISDRKEEFPKLYNFIDTHLRWAFRRYMNSCFDHHPSEVSWSAWAHLCLHGQGLVPHYHMGDEHLTSILYLTESKANLVLRDPRANQVRNWPQEILKTHYPDYQVHPRVGDFVMFPTFIDHYVMAAEPDFRVSVAIDWCFQ